MSEARDVNITCVSVFPADDGSDGTDERATEARDGI